MTYQSKPSVFDFLDASQFLRAHYEWRKKNESEFSLQKWSDELGLGSKITLRFILNRRRRISPKSSLVFRSNLKMNEAEAKCFELLIAYSQAKNTSQKDLFGTELLKIHRSRVPNTPVDAKIATQSIFGPAILTLLTFSDIEKTAENLARLINTEISIVENILEGFESQGIVTRNQNMYAFEANILKVSDSQDLKSFYEYWIERSKRALDLPKNSRKYRALQFAINQEEYEKVLEKLDEYAIGLLSKFSQVEFKNRRLYMYETCLFPISESQEKTKLFKDTSSELKTSDLG